MTEKQAGIGSLITKAKRVVPSIGPSTGTTIQKKVGAMTNVRSSLPTNKYLSKVAEISEISGPKKDLMDTAIIGGMGVASSMVGNHLLSKLYKGKAAPALAAGVVGGGLGILSDFGAVKLNKALGQRFGKKEQQ